MLAQDYERFGEAGDSHELFAMMRLTLALNDRPFYTLTLPASTVMATLYNSQYEGVFLQVQTPGKVSSI